MYHWVATRDPHLGRGQHLRCPLVLAVFGRALHDVGHYRAPVWRRLWRLRRRLLREVVIVLVLSAAAAATGDAAAATTSDWVRRGTGRMLLRVIQISYFCICIVLFLNV